VQYDGIRHLSEVCNIIYMMHYTISVQYDGIRHLP